MEIGAGEIKHIATARCSCISLSSLPSHLNGLIKHTTWQYAAVALCPCAAVTSQRQVQPAMLRPLHLSPTCWWCCCQRPDLTVVASLKTMGVIRTRPFKKSPAAASVHEQQTACAEMTFPASSHLIQPQDITASVFLM